MDKQTVAYIHSGILISLNKEGNSNVITWMNFEYIIQCEISQLQEDKYFMIPFI